MKRFSSIVAPAALLLAGLSAQAEASTIYSTAVEALNPLAYWQFGDANGTVGSSLAGSTSSDGSLTTATGSYGSGVTVGAPIPVAQFPGFTGGNEAVSFAGAGQVSGSDASFPAGNSDRTIIGWVDTTTAPPGPNWNIAMFYGITGTGNSMFLGAPNYGSNDMAASNYGGLVQGATTINDGTWHMIGFTVTATTAGNASYTLYVDGKSDGSGSLQTNTTLGQFFLGNDAINEHYTGELSQLAVFGTALTATQISALYAAAVPEPGSIVLLGLGAAGLLMIHRRRRRRQD